MGQNASWDLAADDTLRLPRQPVVVRVERGTVVVTQASDPEDHVVGAGEEVVLPGGRLAVAWALAPSRLEVRTLFSELGRSAWRSYRQGLRAA